MSRLLTLTLTSHRGRDYPVELFTTDTVFTDSGAVYLYLKMPQGRSLQAQVLYVGEADMLHTQLRADARPGGVWHRAEAQGFDTIGALALARADDRTAIAREFVHSWNPPCNDGHGALTGMIGLAAPMPELRPQLWMAGLRR